jgi:hypothetical protein
MKIGKQLKKNNVAIDIISFGEIDDNNEKLSALVETTTSNENRFAFLEVLKFSLFIFPLEQPFDYGSERSEPRQCHHVFSHHAFGWWYGFHGKRRWRCDGWRRWCRGL